MSSTVQTNAQHTPNTKSVHIVLQRYRSCRVLIDERYWVSTTTTTRTTTNTTTATPTTTSEPTVSSSSKAGVAFHDGNSNSSTQQPQEQGQQTEQQETKHCGLLVYVSFAESATESAVRLAAQHALNAPVLTLGQWGDGISTTTSLVQLVTRGMPHQVSVVIVPQANLISKLKNQGKSIQYHGQVSKDRGQILYAIFCDSIRGRVLEAQCHCQKIPLPEWFQQWWSVHQQIDQQLSLSSDTSTLTYPTDPSIPPKLLFRDSSLYGSWDEETGLPLTEAKSGELITKSALKKLRKIMEAHSKRHEKWRALTGDGSPPTVANTNSGSNDNSLRESENTTTDTPIIQDEALWQTSLDVAFCQIIVGSFGKRQGLEFQSDMGPFCHVFQIC